MDHTPGRTGVTASGASRTRWKACIGAAIGLSVVGVAVGAVAWHGALVRSNQAVLRTEATREAARVDATLRRYEDVVTATKVLVGSGRLDPASFVEMVRANARSADSALQGIGFISASASAAPGLSGGVNGTGPGRCFATAVDWMAGPPPQPLTGVNLCSIAWLRQALAQSQAASQEVVVPAHVLGPRYGSRFLLVDPYYAGAGDGAAVGWSLALLDGDRLMSTGADRSRRLSVQLEYAGAGAGVDVLGRSGPGAIGSGRSLSATVPSDAGLQVRVTLWAGYPGLVPTWAGPLWLLVGGCILSMVFGALTLLLIHARRRAESLALLNEAAREASEARFASLAAASPVGIVEVDEDLALTYSNLRLQEISQRSADELSGRSWMDWIHPDDQAEFTRTVVKAAARRSEIRSTIRLVLPDGGVRAVRVQTAALEPSPVVDHLRFVATVEDVTEELALQEQLRRQALHDPLTGLANRVLFRDRLEQALARGARSGRGVAILFLDVDRFKVVNDSLGHHVGDDLLCRLAERLARVCRSGETVARLGGDEFSVLLTDIDGPEGPVRVANRILDAMSAPLDLAGRELVCTVSIGIFVAGADQSAESALRAADAAMYSAKEAGRGRYALYAEELHERWLHRLTLESELRRAIEERELRVFYQPVVSLSTGEVTGAEALARWEHPHRGLVSPAEFIPLAEETGLIVPLGKRIFEAAVDQLAAWDADPDGPRLGRLAINTSVRELEDRARPDSRRSYLAERGVDPGRFCVEITESALVQDGGVARSTLERIEQLGALLAIDDFGTGYSSLAYLQTLPVSQIKIDRCFVSGLGTSDKADGIVRSIIQMAHGLGLIVVAEGVETESQRRTLEGMDCDAAQGYFWTAPIPADEFADWWRATQASWCSGNERGGASSEARCEDHRTGVLPVVLGQR